MKKFYRAISSFLFLNKKKVIGSLWFEFYKGDIHSECEKCQLIFEPKYIKMKCPPGFSRVQYTTPSYEVLSYKLQTVIVNTVSGIYYLPKSNHYVEEFSSGYGRFRTNAVKKIMAPSWLARNVVNKEKSAYVVCHRGYHGIIEDLSAIVLLTERKENLVIFIDGQNRWVKNVLELLDCGHRIIVIGQKRKWISIDGVVAVSKAPLGEFVHPDLVLLLRKKFLAVYSALRVKADIKIHQKIFISRADSAHRQSRHESNVQSFFESNGYKAVKLSEYTAAHQAILIGSATDIAGFHGAGFVNVLWNQSCSIIEVYDSDHFNFCYAYLSNLCGHKYKAVSVKELLSSK